MITISATSLSKSYGVIPIIENVSFHLNDGEKLGVVGINGTGKTTLLNILVGDIEPDEGSVFISSDKKIGYLRQRNNFSSGIYKDRYDGLTVYEAMKSVEGYDYDSEVTGMLSTMSFDESYYDKPVDLLSGGERSRLALGCILLSKPDILLLDEPTNHLDLNTINKLEKYVKNYKGTVIVVSHDRYFLDVTTDKTLEISAGHARLYSGNYSFYANERKAVRESELKAYQKQQREISKQEDMIRRFKERGTEKLARRAASREKRLAAMDRIQRPEALADKMKLTFKEEFPSGNDVLIAEDISVGYGKPLVENLSFLIRRGERVAFSGANGVGKTTLLKVLTDQMSIISGHLKVGHNVSFGYYDQGQLLLNEQNTVIEEVHQDFRLYTEGEIRNLLARFLFRGDDVFLKVSSLSGGEKARLSLLKLMMGGTNVLVLDEPTNHLDIDSKEAFEDAILEYPGTVIVVSHDRYFLKKIPQRIINLDEYRYGIDTDCTKQKNDVRINSGVTSLQQDGDEMTESAIRRAKRKERQAEERRNRREKQRLEEFIKQHEASIHANEKEMCKPDNLSDFELLAELAAKNDKLKNELERAYEKWIEFE
ncbi:MAG: ABC-F family ATP-binding cassette domain-containing protein [Anaerovoracaceae bacterium]|nr:ABC-F family ATP-binding cassette domain-containing protein [Anaerovoracaceae bacterium]